MKRRTGDPWMSAADFGRSLQGVGFNILVPDIGRSLKFQQQVLGASVVYDDEDFALLEGVGGRWILHADHTYLDHPLFGIVSHIEGRGAGVELRLYQTPPDPVEERARRLGYTILAGSMDKPHGLRECFVVDDDGYVWVPSMPLPIAEKTSNSGS